MSLSSESVHSTESFFSDGCPVSPSLLYEQRDLLFETRKQLRQRKAVTAYRSYKSRSTIGEAKQPCVRDENNHQTDVDFFIVRGINVARQRCDFPRSRTFRLRDKVSNLAMISIGM